MIRKNFAFASIAAALLVSGTAFAADLQPAAGEGPFFQPEAVATSQLKRADVAAQAVAQAPLAGDLPLAQATVTVTSDLSRAQVRETTREAIAQGFHPASGELS